MGTMLLSQGAAPSSCLEALVLEDPARVEAVHRAYREAGAQLIRTHTFGANRHRLDRHGLRGQLKEIIASACALAHATAQGEIFIAGSVGPTGLRLPPLGEDKVSDAAVAYDEVFEALTHSGVDLVIAETFTQLAEAKIAIRSCKSVSGATILMLFSPTDSLRLADEHPIPDVLLECLNLGADGVGLNCVPPRLELGEAFSALCRDLEEMPLALFPSKGVPDAEGAYPLDDDDFAARTAALAPSIGLVGGCCGTTPETIARLNQKLRATVGP